MNVTSVENKAGQTLTIRAVVEAKDYAPEVDKTLKEYRHKANIPGFRPGMVPMSVVEKMYRKGVVAEQAYRKASEAAFKHLEEAKVEMMGDVMPSDEQGEMNFEDPQAKHEFVFEVGLAPKVDVMVNEKDKLTHYTIKPPKAKESKKGDKKEEELPAPSPEQLARESDYLFDIQLKNHILAKANLKLPEDFLKRWLHAVNEGKFTMEEIEKDFAPFLRMMSWNLIMKHLAEKLEIVLNEEDMITESKALARMQFAQYGMADVPEETIEGFAKSILADKNEATRLYERILENRILAALKPLAKVSEKSVTMEEFQKIAMATAN